MKESIEKETPKKESIKKEVSKKEANKMREIIDEVMDVKPSKVLVIIDSGKDSTKATSEDQMIIFKTRVARRSDLNQMDSPDAFVVTYNGEAFVVADEKNTRPDLDMSKKTIEHKICIYSAIAQLVPNGSVVDLVIGIPVLLYLNQEKRAEYVAFMAQPADQEWTEITVQGEAHYFKINQVKALPETAGHVFANYQDYADDLVGVIDIGGLNINGCVYSQLNPVHQTSFTINRGGHHLRAEIQQKLIQTLQRDIQDFQMDGILKKPKARELPIIKEVIDGYLKNILKEMRTRNWDVSEDGIQLVLTGGTSQLIGRYMKLEDYFPNIQLSDNPVLDNVTGFQVYAKAFVG